MDYLLDTSICIDAIRDRLPIVRKRFAAAMRSGAQLFVPTVVAFELWYGVAKSAIPQSNALLVEAFLSGVAGLLDFDHADAQAAGRIRGHLEKSGLSIGAYDLLIVAQAVRHGHTLVTANVREFSRVPGLRWENWSKP